MKTMTVRNIHARRLLPADPRGDAAESGGARLAETIIGVIIALVVLGLTEAIARRRSET